MKPSQPQSSANTPNHHFDTLAIHAGQEPDPTTGAVMTPVYMTSTYAQMSPGKHRGYEYSRTHNPTRTALESCIASLENAEHGLAFASGCGAMTTLLHTLENGDHIICCDDVYGGTYRLLTKVFQAQGIEVDFVDMTNVTSLEKYYRGPKTKLIWIESPTNPLLKILDIKKISHWAKTQKNQPKVVVDNTFLSSYFQSPLALGADYVLHSTTKYMNGHSDVVGGFIATNDAQGAEKLRYLQNALGAVPGPMDCFLTLRGLKTLHIRMERHAKNALSLASDLEKHPKVEKVLYPGLPSHPQYLLACEQMRGFGGMISFYIKSDLSGCRRFLEALRIFTLAESLGGVESLVDHPAIMTHASIPVAERQKLGISDHLVRLSVGIEHVDDLRKDLFQALERV